MSESKQFLQAAPKYYNLVTTSPIIGGIMATSETANKRLIERALQAWDDWDMQTVDEVHASDIVSHGSEADGLDDFKKFLTDWYEAFPDLTHRVEDLVAEGDKVAFRFTVTGTHE